MTRPTHPCGQAFIRYQPHEALPGIQRGTAHVCGESDAYCSTCAEPVLREQVRSLQGLIRRTYAAWKKPHWEEGESLDSVAEDLAWAAEGNIEPSWIDDAPTPGGAEGETG